LIYGSTTQCKGSLNKVLKPAQKRQPYRIYRWAFGAYALLGHQSNSIQIFIDVIAAEDRAKKHQPKFYSAMLQYRCRQPNVHQTASYTTSAHNYDRKRWERELKQLVRHVEKFDYILTAVATIIPGSPLQGSP